MITTNSYRYPLHLPDVVKIPEAENRLTDAYSALKDIHIQMKMHFIVLKKENKQLREELEDYKIRYDNLIKQLNSDEYERDKPQ